MSAPTRVHACGPRALLAEYASLDEVMRAHAALRAVTGDDIVEIIPAARTILVETNGALEEVTALLRSLVTDVVAVPARSAPVEIDVRYDGEDLAAVARARDMSLDEVIALHSGREYTCAFCGFLPGFSYLVALDPRLEMPRRTTPRTRVPAGSVAIAGEFASVYPSASPGGWHLLGVTDAVMWDESRPSPALLPPGTHVRFRPV